MSDGIFAGRSGWEKVPGSAAHAQIERWFIDAMSRGEIRPGDRLPAESELAAHFGVSRMTLRQSLAGLAARGVVQRKAGRSGGTFIVEPRIECDLTGLAGFTEQLRRSQVRASARVIAAGTVPARRAVAAALDCDGGAPVHEIVRVRSAAGRPMALERSYFPAAVFPDLLDHRLGGSLYALLGRHYQQHPRTAQEYLEPVVPSDDDARLLDTEPGSALMLIERTARTVSGLAVEFARDLFRPDRIRISVRSGWSEPGSTASPATVR